MIGCLRTRVCKQPIIALYFESENELKFYNLEAWPSDKSVYCKFGNFRENFIFTNNVDRHICDVKLLRFGHDLLISVNDRVICPFARVLYAKFHANKTFTNAKISKIDLL